MRYLVGIGSLFLGLAAPAWADTPPHITVNGTGLVHTMPDQATISFAIRGEGATSDAALAQMVARRARIDAGLAVFRQIEPRASQVSISEVRGNGCQPSYGQQRLSTGDCAIIGYIAELSVTVRTTLVKQAGTIVGLVGRLEGTSPRIERFALADPGAAQRRAIAEALADARRKADAIAAGTGVKIGRLISASSGGYNDIPVEDALQVQSVPPPPPPPPPPTAHRGRPHAAADRHPGASECQL